MHTLTPSPRYDNCSSWTGKTKAFAPGLMRCAVLLKLHMLQTRMLDYMDLALSHLDRLGSAMTGRRWIDCFRGLWCGALDSSGISLIAIPRLYTYRHFHACDISNRKSGEQIEFKPWPEIDFFSLL